MRSRSRRPRTKWTDPRPAPTVPTHAARSPRKGRLAESATRKGTTSTMRRPRSRAPGSRDRPPSECLGDCRANKRGVGFTRRARNLFLATEDDQRTLVLDTELLQQVFRSVEIDF